MNKTNISWADMTWNPVTGCLHGCEYCYARKIANRFAPKLDDGEIAKGCGLNDVGDTNIPFPWGFEPTLYRNRLEEPQRTKKPQRIFVCSMADLFGNFIPDEWIQEVFEACEKAPWHKYLFLTKNPKRYRQLKRLPGENCWLGATIGQDKDKDYETIDEMAYLSNNFLSAEPLHYDISNMMDYDNIDWVIVGQETGNRKGKIEPEDSWIRFLRDGCIYYEIPLFIKEPLYKRFPIQEFPKGLEADHGKL